MLVSDSSRPNMIKLAPNPDWWNLATVTVLRSCWPGSPTVLSSSCSSPSLAKQKSLSKSAISSQLCSASLVLHPRHAQLGADQWEDNISCETRLALVSFNQSERRMRAPAPLSSPLLDALLSVLLRIVSAAVFWKATVNHCWGHQSRKYKWESKNIRI